MSKNKLSRCPVCKKWFNHWKKASEHAKKTGHYGDYNLYGLEKLVVPERIKIGDFWIKYDGTIKQVQDLRPKRSKLAESLFMIITPTNVIFKQGFHRINLSKKQFFGLILQFQPHNQEQGDGA